MNLNDVNLNKFNYQIILFKGKIKWILFGDYNSYNFIFKEWKPYGYINNILWQIIRLFLKIRIKRIPFILKYNTGNDNNFYVKGYLVNAIIIGNNNDYKKYILFATKDNIKVVIKMPYSNDSLISIKNEASTLRRLNANSYFPKLIFSNKSLLIQSFSSGSLISLDFNIMHFDLLSRFPRTNGYINVDKYFSINPLYKNKSLLLSLKSKLSRKTFRSFFEHGDFTPWNIRNVHNKYYTIFDFEFSSFCSFAYMDVLHYIFTVEIFIKKNTDIDNIFNKFINISSNLEIQNIYNEKFELDYIILYLIKSIIKRQTHKVDIDSNILDTYLNIAKKIL